MTAAYFGQFDTNSLQIGGPDGILDFTTRRSSICSYEERMQSIEL